MRLVLTYAGPLPSNGTAADKHKIRQSFHPQLEQQWKIEDSLTSIANFTETISGKTTKRLDKIADSFTRGKFRFVPLVVKSLDLVCFMEVTLLRREEPGDLLKNGGDIDNRLKTLFDSLSVPQENAVSSLAPSGTENPFYCLLEDDHLVTGLQVKTERLLEPPADPAYTADVRIILNATIRPTKVTVASLAFLGGWL